MSDPSGSPSERQAPGASSPDTAPRPAQFQRVEERLHSRCGTHHRPNCCVIPMIKGIGPVIRAGLPGLCPICSIDIVYQGETEERDQIMAFMDFGYVHRDCVAQLLKPYHGPQAKPIAERMNEALAGESAPIVEYIVRARGGALEYSAYEISKAAPGAGKTKVLAINAAVLGPLKCLNVAYNVDASLTLRARGAINSHTMHSLGMRAISRCVKESIKDRRLSKEFSSYDAPPNLQLSLISEGKTLLLISYMHPPGEDDGLNAKVSLIFKVFGTFVQALYEAATTRAFGIGGRPGMSDVASLSKLAFELHLSTKFIVPALGRLSKPEMQRLNAVCNTTAARVSAACMMIAEVHTASLTAMTNPIWYVNGNKVLHLVHPITGVSHRLPCCSYNEQICGTIYCPEMIKPIVGSYDTIQLDECQDNSEARAVFCMMLLECSDANAAGNTNHFTFFRAVGDPDQAITGWSGGLIDATTRMIQLLEARTARKISIYEQLDLQVTIDQCAGVLTSLPVSERCPISHIALANQTFDGAFSADGYAADALFRPDPDRTTRMVPKEGAIKGEIVRDATFGRYGEYLNFLVNECSPDEGVGMGFRRGNDAHDASTLLVKYAIPHKLNLVDRKMDSLLYIRTTLRLLIEMANAPPPAADAPALVNFGKTIGELRNRLPGEGLPGVVSAAQASCILNLARELPLMATIEELVRHAEARFSPYQCARLRLTTAHSSKGATFRTMIIGQPQFFPLERNVTDGGIGLAQEPNVEYVSLTRATHRLVFLVESDNSNEETNMETLFMEL